MHKIRINLSSQASIRSGINQLKSQMRREVENARRKLEAELKRKLR